MIGTVDDVEAKLHKTRNLVAGSLRVTAPIAFGLHQISPVLPKFLSTHPELSVSLSLTDDSTSLVEDRIDVAVRMGRLQDSSLLSKKICDLRRVVVASPGFVAEHGTPNTPSDLAKFDCLLWQGALDHLNRWPFMIEGKQHHIPIEGRFRSNNGMSLFQMCVSGVGIMRLAEHLARPEIAAGRLVPLLEAYQSPEDGAFHAVFLPDREQLPRVRAFIDFLVATFRTPAW